MRGLDAAGALGFAALICGDAAAASAASAADAGTRPAGARPADAPARWGRPATAADPWLFVAGQANNVVNAYDLVAPGQPLVETITTGVDSPVGLTIDAAGTLYVSNAGGNVTIYPAGQTSPTPTLPVHSPVGVAIDRMGTIFVATRDAPPTILEFRPGSTTPLQTIVSNLLVVPSEIAFARTGLLDITDNVTGVSVMKSGSTTIASPNLLDLDHCTTGIVISERRHEFFVSGCNGGTQVYPFGATAPSGALDEQFPADNLGIGDVSGREYVFAPDLFSSSVTFYHVLHDQRMRTMNTGSAQALGIALKPAGVP